MGISMIDAQLGALIAQCILYGVCATLSSAAIYALVFKRAASDSKILLAAVVAMFLVATAHLIDVMDRAVGAFGSRGGGNAALAYLDMARPNDVAEGALATLQILIGDSVLIYRLHIIWGRRWSIVIFPVICTLGSGVAGFGAAGLDARANSPAVFVATVPKWMIGIAATTVATNLYCTGLIALKIFSSMKSASAYARPSGGSKSITNIAFATVIESAAIYCATVIAFLVLAILESNALFIVLYLQPPLIGAIFSLIILRVSLGLSNYGSLSTASNASSQKGMDTKYRSRRLASNDLELGFVIRPMPVCTDGLVKGSPSEVKFNEM